MYCNEIILVRIVSSSKFKIYIPSEETIFYDFKSQFYYSLVYWQVLLKLRAAKYMVIPLFWALNILSMNVGLRPDHIDGVYDDALGWPQWGWFSIVNTKACEYRRNSLLSVRRYIFKHAYVSITWVCGLYVSQKMQLVANFAHCLHSSFRSLKSETDFCHTSKIRPLLNCKWQPMGLCWEPASRHFSLKCD